MNHKLLTLFQMVQWLLQDQIFLVQKYQCEQQIYNLVQNINMILRNQRDFSAPHQKLIRQSYEQNRKSKALNSPISESKQLILRFDINTLLSSFNEMEVDGGGEISRKAIKKIMQNLGLRHYDHYLKGEDYTFGHFLSILGEIQVPSQPSIYVISFVKVLANYRDKCIRSDQQGLYQAKEVQQKIKMISQNQLERQKLRIKQEHGKIYDEMHISQEKQFKIFEDQWKCYLKQFRQETNRRLHQTKYLKKSKIVEQQNKFIAKTRKNNILTSPRLRELVQKKKWLIQEKNYDNAIQINNEISREREKLSEYKQVTNDQILTKKLQKLSLNTNRYLGAIQKNLQVNLNRLVSKKKEGQNIMKIRMKNLRQEANKKLNEHYRTEINRLRNSFYIAANH